MEFSAAILAKNETDFREKVERVRPLGLSLHVDVMDGIFVPERCWADPLSVQEIAGNTPFSAHLMVSDPEHAAAVWLAAGAATVWIHAEATRREGMILRSDSRYAGRLGLAINPETPISRIIPIMDSIEAVLVMGVTPGRSGQGFQEITLEKIQALKELRPNLWIEADGGVGPDNIAQIAAAGADAVAAASSLTNAPDPSSALAAMREAL